MAEVMVIVRTNPSGAWMMWFLIECADRAVNLHRRSHLIIVKRRDG